MMLRGDVLAVLRMMTTCSPAADEPLSLGVSEVGKHGNFMNGDS